LDETRPLEIHEGGGDSRPKDHSEEKVHLQEDEVRCNKSEEDESLTHRDILPARDGRLLIEDARFCSRRKEEIEVFRKALPIYYEEPNIISMVRCHEVMMIHGETGCGKTTQVPQFLFENGFAKSKMIGLTQPRRVSAIAVSKRINEEINESVSGYKIKYEDSTNKTLK
jgi:HrpA-like RNA helicase